MPLASLFVLGTAQEILLEKHWEPGLGERRAALRCGPCTRKRASGGGISMAMRPPATERAHPRGKLAGARDRKRVGGFEPLCALLRDSLREDAGSAAHPGTAGMQGVQGKCRVAGVGSGHRTAQTRGAFARAKLRKCQNFDRGARRGALSRLLRARSALPGWVTGGEAAGWTARECVGVRYGPASATFTCACVWSPVSSAPGAVAPPLRLLPACVRRVLNALCLVIACVCVCVFEVP